MHTVGLVPVHPATRGDHAAAAARARLGRARPLMLAAGEPLPARLRVDEGLAERAAALDAVHFPETRGRGARRAPPARVRGAVPAPARGGRPAARAPRGPARAAARRRAAWWWTAGAGRCRSSSRATRSGRSTEIDADLGARAADAAAADGGGGSGQDAWWRSRAMLRAVENGAQAALMAPTETLAEQHHRTLDRLLGGPIPVELLTGSTHGGAAARAARPARRAAQLQLVVGTHALIEEPVEFRDLAVVVVDEQHRFGVRQRAALDAKAPGGARAARAAHDRHADPAHALAHRVRRPRRDRAARAAARAGSRSRPTSWTAPARGRAPTSASARRSPRAASASWSARSSRSRRRSRPRRRRRSSSACARPSSPTCAWS